MRLLVDARPIVDPAQGGVSRVARELVTAYAETFPQDELICVTTGSKRPQLPTNLTKNPNVTHEHIAIPNKLWSAMCFFALVSLVGSVQKRRGTIDAAFFPNLGFVGTLPHDVPTSLLLHDLSFLIEPRWFSWKQRLWHRAVKAKTLVRSVTHLLSVSETTKRDAIQLLGIPEERIRVIPVGPTLSAPPNKLQANKLTSSPRFLLAMGSSDPRKNIQTIVEAVNVLRQDPKFTDVELIVTGSTNRPTDEELLSLYANASAFLYPSWYEGYGLPLHEAAAFGTPCIASTAGALPETARRGTIFANPAKPHEWVEAMRNVLMTKPLTRSDLQKDAWRKASELIRKSRP